MANDEQLSILKQGVAVWNEWRAENLDVDIDLSYAELNRAHLSEADLRGGDLRFAHLIEAELADAQLIGTDFRGADLRKADLRAGCWKTDFRFADLSGADLRGALLEEVLLGETNLAGSNFSKATIGDIAFDRLDLSDAIGLEDANYRSPSRISTDTFTRSKGKIPEAFLRGCGLSDWEIQMAKLYNPDLSNEERNKLLYMIYDLQASQPIQISPLFISYNHGDGTFVDKLESQLNKKGIRFWLDIHEMKAGRIETQIDRGIRQNPTVLLVLSRHSLSSDWVEHEVRTARGLEKELGRDVLCPVALDDSWKSSPWPERVMEQIMEYNILDFSEWKDESKFEGIFRKLIDGLELFYKG